MRSKNAITKLSSIPVTCATSLRNNASTLHPTRSEYDVHNNAIGAPECLANQSESRTTCTGCSSPMSNELYSNAAGNHCSYVRNDAMPLVDLAIRLDPLHHREVNVDAYPIRKDLRVHLDVGIVYAAKMPLEQFADVS